MKLYTGVTNQGITFRLEDEERRRLAPDPAANQVSPARFYVYAHTDAQGTYFYIGKGTNRRAWNDARHPLWTRFVEKHLRGNYTVKILADDLSSDEAEALETAWMAQEAETLVNWENPGRKTDFALLDRFHSLRNANRELIARARTLEKDSPDEAVTLYRRAVENAFAYASIQPERGLVGKLLDEERAERGLSGEIVALDRLTLCLVRLGRSAEAATAADDYFARFSRDSQLTSAAAIRRRVAKSQAL